jgi:hypothetical protein
MCRSNKKDDLKLLENNGVLSIVLCSTDGSCNIPSTKVGKSFQSVYDALRRLGGRGNVTKNNDTIHVEREARVGVYSAAKTAGYEV